MEDKAVRFPCSIFHPPSSDILIIGGGTAGAVAGIAAARAGARTLIVEPLSFLGGTQTGALVTPMMPNHVGGAPMTSRLNEEILDRLEATGDTGGTSGNRGWFNPEMLKCVLDDMAAEAGCEVLFQTMFESAIVEDGRIAGVTVVNKAGRREIRAARVVDATGDADVAVSAGCPYESGGPDGARQAMSLRWLAGGVDLQKFCEWLDARGGHGFRPHIVHYMSIWGRGEPLEPFLAAAVEDGLLERGDGDFFQFFSVPGRPGEVAFNCPRLPGSRDGADPMDLSRAHVDGRRAIRRLLAFCRARLPGFEDAYLSQIAPMAGVRETRRIVGEYTLTAEDCAAARKFPDAIARCNYPLDIHSPHHPGGTYRQPLPSGAWYEIPYRCLLPLRVEDLLVAGRCISADFEAQSSARIQAPVRAMGEAAGIAAALSLQHGVSPRALDPALVQAAMGFEATPPLETGSGREQ